MSFREAYEEYKEYAKKRHKKQGFYTITHDFNNHVFPYFENCDIEKLEKKDFLKWQNAILDLSFKNKYNSKLYIVFSSFLNYCVMRDFILKNYLIEIGTFPKKIENNTHMVYTIKQFRKFRYFLDDYVIKEYFNFIYFYGTRPGETMGLRFCDIKFRNVKITHNLITKGEVGLDTLKNQSSIRNLKMSRLTVFRIWKLKRYYIKKYGVFNDDYFVFGGQKHLSHTTIDRYKKKAYEKAKLPSITQHEFRHSYATRKIHKKVPIDVVSRSMGHSQVSTTLDIYVHQEKKYV